MCSDARHLLILSLNNNDYYQIIGTYLREEQFEVTILGGTSLKYEQVDFVAFDLIILHDDLLLRHAIDTPTSNDFLFHLIKPMIILYHRDLSQLSSIFKSLNPAPQFFDIQRQIWDLIHLVNNQFPPQNGKMN